jgi:hypothetical protein
MAKTLQGIPDGGATDADRGDSHPPITNVTEIVVGGPASQLTDNEKMPEGFAAPCVEASRSALQPRATAAQAGKIAPGKEAPRVMVAKPRDHSN